MLPVTISAVYRKTFGNADLSAKPRLYRHNQHTLSCLVRGRGRYLIGKNDYRIEAPILAVLPAGDLDGNGLVGPYESGWVGFTWAGLGSEGGGHAVKLQGPHGAITRPHFRRLGNSELTRVIVILKQLVLWNKRPEISLQLRSGAAILELLAMWSEPTRDETSPYVIMYRDLIEQYADDPECRLEQLAERVGMSAEHLSVLFRKTLGVTPVLYRESIRVARAKDLLATTLMDIAEISRNCGYADPNYFSRVFKRHTGYRPSDFSDLQRAPQRR